MFSKNVDIQAFLEMQHIMAYNLPYHGYSKVDASTVQYSEPEMLEANF
jgi:hypothetical protein